ncbi:MAG: glycosyltransferase [Crocinitomicaceae bacterium]
MKVLIVGLPLFAERLANALTEYDHENRYIHLDTYYKKADQLKALWRVPRVDCVVSINGTIVGSRVFDLAFQNKVPLIMNWVGTDVLKSTKAFKEGNFKQHYIDNATHFCEVGWIQEELKEIGINAEVVNFAAFKKSYELKEVGGDQLTILSYIPSKRSDFYGMKTMIRMAEKLPSVRFLIAGTDGDEYKPLPPNMTALGWVKNMDEVYDKTHVCVRFTDHDGLSNFILESLARGKQVIYRNPFENCEHCPDEDMLVKEIANFETKFKNGNTLLNPEGAQFISDEFNEEVILGGFLERIKQVVGNK